MNTATDSLVTDTPKTDSGFNLGQSITDKVALYGVTPVVQPSGADQGEITDASGGTANTATGIVTITATYNSTILANALATLAAQGNALRQALVDLGAIKGGA